MCKAEEKEWDLANASCARARCEGTKKFFALVVDQVIVIKMGEVDLKALETCRTETCAAFGISLMNITVPLIRNLSGQG